MMKKLLILTSLIVSIQTVSADCVDNIPKTSGPFNSTGLVGQSLDESTGLVWYQCRLGEAYDSGSCTGEASSVNWLETLNEAESFEFGGFSNWRLPNIKELQSIAEYSCHSPVLDPDVFLITQGDLYWSSTPETVNDGGLFQERAYFLRSEGGTRSDQKNETFSALLVRDSE